MNRILTILTLLLASIALAGCHAPEGDHAGDETDSMSGDANDGDMGHDAGGDMEATQSMTLTVKDAPESVMVGDMIQMTVDVEATIATTSIHSGFHFSYNSTAGNDALTGADFDGKSPHVTNETSYPGSYTIPEWEITQEMADAGTIYVRAHVATEDGDFWGDEFAITVTA